MPLRELAFHATRVAGIWQRYARPGFLGWALGVLAAGLLIVREFPAGGNDDTHITYWVAHALATRGRIENYNGLLVEQSSSLSLVFLLAFFEWLSGLGTPVLGWVSSLVLGALTLALVPRLSTGDSKYAAFWSPVLLGTWLPFLYWSTSGMEMTLLACAGCATALLAGRSVDAGAANRRGIFALLALAGTAFVLVRPETPLELVLALALGAMALLFRRPSGADTAPRRPLRRALLLLASALALVLAVGLLRWFVFGLVVPNPAAAKSGAFGLAAGASYLWKGIVLGGPAFPALALLGTVAVVASVRAGRAPTRTVVLAGWGFSALAFVVGSGGDWMPGARLLVPLGPALAVLGGEALAVLGGFKRWAAHAAGAAVVASNVASVLAFGGSGANGSYRGLAAHDGARALVEPDAADFSFSELANRAHRRDARLLGPTLELFRRLKPTADDPIYFMSGQAGMVPFYVFREFHGRARFIDLYTLTTPEILPCIPSRHRKHQLQGVHVSPGYIIDHADEMEGACGARRPHVVFSTGRCPAYLKQRNYECFYQGPRGLEAFVAVDRETLKKSGMRAKR